MQMSYGHESRIVEVEGMRGISPIMVSLVNNLEVWRQEEYMHVYLDGAVSSFWHFDALH